MEHRSDLELDEMTQPQKLVLIILRLPQLTRMLYCRHREDSREVGNAPCFSTKFDGRPCATPLSGQTWCLTETDLQG
jgi:hypothetical protein